MRRPPVFERLAAEIRVLRGIKLQFYWTTLSGEWSRRGSSYDLKNETYSAWTGYPIAIETVHGHGSSRPTSGIDAHLWICEGRLRLVRRDVLEMGDGRVVTSRKLVLRSLDEAGGARELVRLCEGYGLDPERVLAAVRDEANRHRRVQSCADGAPLALAS